MTKIGSLKEARELAAAVIKGDFGWKRVDDSLLPEGWRHLADGGWRTVWVGPSGTVYKVDKDGKSNELEHKRYRSVGRDDSRGFRFARCTYYVSADHILAMEYIKDDDSNVDASYARMDDYMRKLGYRDCGTYKRKMNWHGVKGEAIITDYAYGYEE